MYYRNKKIGFPSDISLTVNPNQLNLESQTKKALKYRRDVVTDVSTGLSTLPPLSINDNQNNIRLIRCEN